jgi:hypothetical protein
LPEKRRNLRVFNGSIQTISSNSISCDPQKVEIGFNWPAAGLKGWPLRKSRQTFRFGHNIDFLEESRNNYDISPGEYAYASL